MLSMLRSLNIGLNSPFSHVSTKKPNYTVLVPGKVVAKPPVNVTAVDTPCTTNSMLQQMFHMLRCSL